VSPKCSALALDETKEFDRSYRHDRDYEPHLKVIVNAHYLSTSSSQEVTQVKGSITVSF